MAARKILLLNGPNLDMLGIREPEVYGSQTLDELEEEAVLHAQKRGVVLTCFQSNSESELVEKIHNAVDRYDGIVYNPGAHTHYSYALRDAVGSIDVPVVEVHISNIDDRELFRRKSVIAPACVAQVKGLGFDGYCKAIDILCEHDGLGRLGEGYDERFPLGQKIVVGEWEGAGSAQVPMEASSVAPLEQPAPDSDINYAAPYAQDIAAVNKGAVSFERQCQVRELCAQLGLDALLVRDTSNISWITCFDGVFDEERAHALLISRGQSAIHTDSRYANAMRVAARNISSDIVVKDERISHAQFAKEELASLAFQGTMGIEDTITYAEFAKVVEAFGAEHLAATTNVVSGLRAVKSDVEFSCLLAAQAVTDAAFAHIVGFMRPGMTEREVQLELEQFMLRHGAESLAFSSIVATGPNGADPHAIPGDKRLEVGQCVVMDFGAKALGYCSDMTRTVFIGEPDQRMRAAWETLRRANEAVEAALRPGVTGKEMQELAEGILAEGGFGGTMGHGLGHGVGLDVHELPVLNAKGEIPLVSGNVVTVEPGIYLPGEFGMRLEDCGVVTETGYEAFSQIGHEMIVI